MASKFRSLYEQDIQDALAQIAQPSTQRAMPSIDVAKAQTLARSSSNPRAQQAGRDMLAEDDRQRVAGARQAEADQKRAEIEAKRVATEQSKAAEDLRKRNVRAGAAAGMKVETDVESGKRTIATDPARGGAPVFETGPVGDPRVVKTTASPFYDPKFKRQANEIPDAIVQDYRNAAGDMKTAPLPTKTDPKTGAITAERKDEFGAPVTQALGTDQDVKRKADALARIEAESAAVALRANAVDQTRLRFQPQFEPVKKEFDEASKELTRVQEARSKVWRTNKAGAWEKFAPDTGRTVPFDKAEIPILDKRETEAKERFARAKAKHDPMVGTAANLDRNDTEVKAQTLRLRAEKIRIEQDLPDNDGGLAEIMASAETGILSPDQKAIGEAAAPQYPMVYAPEVLDAQAAKDAATSPKGTPVSPLPQAGDGRPSVESEKIEGLPPKPLLETVSDPESALKAFSGLQGIEGLTLSPPNATFTGINNAAGKWIGSIEDAGNGMKAIVLNDAAHEDAGISKTVALGVTGGAPVYFRDSGKPKDATKEAAWVGSVIQGMKLAPDAQMANNQVRMLGATREDIKEKVNAGEISIQSGEALMQNLYGDTLKPADPESPQEFARWIAETSKQENASHIAEFGTPARETVATRWGNTTNLKAKAEVRREFIRDWAIANRGKPGVDREKLKAMYGVDVADSATRMQRVGSALKTGGRMIRDDVAGSMIGLAGKLVYGVGAAEAALFGVDGAKANLGELAKLTNRDTANFIDAAERNRKLWFTPEGQAIGLELDTAVRVLQDTVDAEQDKATPDKARIAGAEMAVRQAALKLHGLSPDEAWPITEDSLDPDKDPALGAALARYALTADPREMALYKERLLMSNGRRQFSAELEKKTARKGSFGGAVTGAMYSGWQEIGSEMVADAGILFTAGGSKVVQAGLKGIGAVNKASKVARLGTKLGTALDDFAKLGIKSESLVTPLTAGQRRMNTAVGVTKTGVQASVGEGMEEVLVEVGADSPDFVTSFASGALGGVALVPVFHLAGSAVAGIPEREAQAKRDAANVKWTANYNASMADVKGFQAITPEQAMIARSFVDPQEFSGIVGRVAEARKTIDGINEAMVPGATPEEIEALKGQTHASLDQAITELAAQTEGGIAAVNAIAAVEDPAKQAFYSGLAKVATGNTAALTQSERSAIAGGKTQAGAPLFVAVAQPDGSTREVVTDEARAELMLDMPAVGQLIQTTESQALVTAAIDAAQPTPTTDVTDPQGQPGAQAAAQDPQPAPADPNAPGGPVSGGGTGGQAGGVAANGTGAAPAPPVTAQSLAERVKANVEAALPGMVGRIKIEEKGFKDNRTGGAAANDDGTVSLILPDIAKQLEGFAPADVESALQAIVIAHEVVHVVQFSALRSQWDGKGSFDTFWKGWYGKMASELDPAAFKAARAIYGEQDWDALPSDAYRAAEIVRMLVEALLNPKDADGFSELFRAIQLKTSQTLIETIRIAIEMLVELIKTGKLPESARIHVEQVTALYKELTAKTKDAPSPVESQAEANAEPSAENGQSAPEVAEIPEMDSAVELEEINETIRAAVRKALKDAPALTNDARFDLQDVAFDMAELLLEVPVAQRQAMVEAAIGAYLDSQAAEAPEAPEKGTESQRAKAKAYRAVREEKIRKQARAILNSGVHEAFSAIFQKGKIAPMPNIIGILAKIRKDGGNLSEAQRAIWENTAANYNGVLRQSDYPGGGSHPVLRAMFQMIYARQGDGQAPNVMADGLLPNMTTASEMWEQLGKEARAISRGKGEGYNPLDDPNYEPTEAEIAEWQAKQDPTPETPETPEVDTGTPPVGIPEALTAAREEFGNDHPLTRKIAVFAGNLDRVNEQMEAYLVNAFLAETGRIRAGVLSAEEWQSKTSGWNDELKKLHRAIASHTAETLEAWIKSQPVIEEEEAMPLFSSAAQALDNARFNELTKDLDPQDIEGWKASHPEELKELTAMRERVLKAAGYETEAYHGTDTPEFEEFNTERTLDSGKTADPNAFIGAHFSKSRNVAEKFAEELYDAKDGRVISVRLRLTNPLKVGEGEATQMLSEMEQASNEAYAANQVEQSKFEQSKPEPTQVELEARLKAFEESDNIEDLLGPQPEIPESLKAATEKASAAYQAFRDARENNRPVTEREILEFAGYDYDKVFAQWESKPRSTAERVGRRVREALEAAGYDGVVYTIAFEAEGGVGTKNRTAYIALYPEQIKSADPLALDASGKLITPDQWGDTGNPSILFSSPTPDQGGFSFDQTTDSGDAKQKGFAFEAIPEGPLAKFQKNAQAAYNAQPEGSQARDNIAAEVAKRTGIPDVKGFVNAGKQASFDFGLSGSISNRDQQGFDFNVQESLFSSAWPEDINAEVLPVDAPSPALAKVISRAENYRSMVVSGELPIGLYAKIQRYTRDVAKIVIEEENLAPEAVAATLNQFETGSVGQVIALDAFLQVATPKGYGPVFEWEHAWGNRMNSASDAIAFWGSKDSFGSMVNIHFIPLEDIRDQSMSQLSTDMEDRHLRVAWKMKKSNPYYVRMATRNELKAIVGRKFIERVMQETKGEFTGKLVKKRTLGSKTMQSQTALTPQEQRMLADLGMTAGQFWDVVRKGDASLVNKLAAEDSMGRRDYIQRGMAMGPLKDGVTTTGTLFPMDITTSLPFKPKKPKKGKAPEIITEDPPRLFSSSVWDTEDYKLWRFPDEQVITSAETSINSKVPAAGFKSVQWKAGTVNADIGGGKFDNATDMLKSLGVENVIFDPHNRDLGHNKKAVSQIKDGQSDTATVFNVLNVIMEPEVRELVIRQAANSLKPGGIAIFQIYEGDKSGVGRATPKGWQENRKTDSYVTEITRHFKETRKFGGNIVAMKPFRNDEVLSMPTAIFSKEERMEQIALLSSSIGGQEFFDFGTAASFDTKKQIGFDFTGKPVEAEKAPSVGTGEKAPSVAAPAESKPVTPEAQSESLEVFTGTRAEVDARKPGVVLAIARGDQGKRYTLWQKVGRRQWDYIRTLPSDKNEAIDTAALVARRIASGEGAKVAFYGGKTYTPTPAEVAQGVAVTTDELTKKDLDEAAPATDIGTQTVGFGKYANELVSDLAQIDPDYALWFAGNASSGRGNQIKAYLERDPAFLAYRDADQASKQADAERIAAAEAKMEAKKNAPKIQKPAETEASAEQDPETPGKPATQKLERRQAADQYVSLLDPIEGLKQSVAPELRRHMFPMQESGADAAIASMEANGSFLNGDGAGVGKTRQILAVASHYAALGHPVVIITENAAIGKPWEGKGTPAVGGSMAKDSEAMGVEIELMPDDGIAENGRIRVTTYNRVTPDQIRPANPFRKGVIVIFDESQNLANIYGDISKETGNWKEKFSQIFSTAEKTAYYSATPADKPHQLAYLYRVLGFETPDDYIATALKNGMITRVRKFGRQEQRSYDVPGSQAGRVKLYRWVNALMKTAGAEGRFIKREISYEGTDIQFQDVIGKDITKNEWASHYDDVMSTMGDAMGRGAQILAPRSYELYAAELTKIGKAVELAKRELAAGRKVILYFSRIREMEMRARYWITLANGERVPGDPFVIGTIPSPVELLKAELQKEGIAFAELHGKSGDTSKTAQAKFSKDVDVLLASVESGGTGINLDDTIGNNPRTEIFMFAPYRGISTIQAMGRIWRASTIQNDNNPNRFAFIVASDIGADAGRSAVLGKKIQLMNATLGGTAVQKLPMSKVSFDKDQLIGLEIPEEGETSNVETGPLSTAPLKPVNIQWKLAKSGATWWARATADLLEWVADDGPERTGLGVKVVKKPDGYLAFADSDYQPEEFAQDGGGASLFSSAPQGGQGFFDFGTTSSFDTKKQLGFLFGQEEVKKAEAEQKQPTVDRVEPAGVSPEPGTPDFRLLPQEGKREIVKAKTEAKAAEKSGITDFGEKLDIRKNRPTAKNADLSDGDMESMPFSKIWPKAEVDAIEDVPLASMATVFRESVPAKPRDDWKVQRWIGKVKIVQEFMRLANEIGVEAVLVLMENPKESSNLNDLASKIRILSTIPRPQWDRISDVRNRPDAVRFGKDENGNWDTSVRIPAPYAEAKLDGKRIDAMTFTELAEKVQAAVGGETEAPRPGKPLKFEVRFDRVTYFINKKGDPLRRSLASFETSKEAFEFIKNNPSKLAAEWDAIKERENVKKDDLRGKENRPRQGQDWRNGNDATPEMFEQAFGFRGVAFGKWVEQGGNARERQGMFNLAYDSFMDLAKILGVPPTAMSLEGTLGLAFGADGSGSASAHYNPQDVHINLTKTRGAGVLAHEFFHALDNYFQKKRPGKSNTPHGGDYITFQPETYYQDQRTGHRLSAFNFHRIQTTGGRFANINDWKRIEGVRPEVEEQFAALVKALDASPMAKRAKAVDKGKDGYWSRIIERAARSFENYVIHKMMQDGYHNDYLANVMPPESFVRDPELYPYLLEGEIEPIAEAFDNLFGTIQTEETDKGVRLFSSAPIQPDLFTAATAPDATQKLGTVKVGTMNALGAYRALTAKREKLGKLSAEEEEKLLQAETALGQKLAFDMEAVRGQEPKMDLAQKSNNTRPGLGQKTTQQSMFMGPETTKDGQMSLFSSAVATAQTPMPPRPPKTAFERTMERYFEEIGTKRRAEDPVRYEEISKEEQAKDDAYDAALEQWVDGIPKNQPITFIKEGNYGPHFYTVTRNTTDPERPWRTTYWSTYPRPDWTLEEEIEYEDLFKKTRWVDSRNPQWQKWNERVNELGSRPTTTDETRIVATGHDESKTRADAVRHAVSMAGSADPQIGSLFSSAAPFREITTIAKSLSNPANQYEYTPITNPTADVESYLNANSYKGYHAVAGIADTRRIEEISGTSIVFVKGPPKLTLGGNNTLHARVISINTEYPHASIGYGIVHELVHVAQKDSRVNMRKLLADIVGMLSREEIRDIAGYLENYGYVNVSPEMLASEMQAFLMADAVLGTPYIALDRLENAEPLRKLLRDFFESMPRLSPDNGPLEIFSTGTQSLYSSAAPAIDQAVRDARKALDSRRSERDEISVTWTLDDDRMRDAEYLELAKDPEGNREALQAMVDEAARRAGYATLAFKGMLTKAWRTGEIITVLKSANGDWAGFFSSDKAVADGFQRAFATMDDAKTIRVYLDMAGAVTVDAKGGRAREFQFDNINPINRRNDMLDLVTNSKRGVIVENTDDEATVYVPKSSSQIKSADPVTYDADGNIIPLSQRFNPASDSILYSSAAPDPGSNERLDGQGNPQGIQSYREYFQERVIAAQDFVEEMRGAKVNADGSITVYHGTSKANQEAMLGQGEILRGGFFSLRKGGQEFGDSPLDVAKRKHGKEGVVMEIKVDARSIESAAAGSEIYAPEKLIRGDDGIWTSVPFRGGTRLLSSSAPAPEIDWSKFRPLFRKVYSDMLSGMTLAQIAKTNGLTERQVTGILTSISTVTQATGEAATTGLRPKTDDEGLMEPGRPERAMSGNPEVARILQIRQDNGDPEVIANAATYEAAKRMIAKDYQGTIERIINRRAAGEDLTLDEVAAAQMLILNKTGKARSELTEAERVQLAWLAMDWIEQGTDDARRLQIRRDVTHNPAERAALYFQKELYTPQDAQTVKAIQNAKGRAAKEEVLKRFLQRSEGLKARLLAQGIDIEASLESFRRQQDEKAAMEKAVDDAHARLTGSYADEVATLQRQLAEAAKATADAQAAGQASTAEIEALKTAAAEMKDKLNKARTELEKVRMLSPSLVLRTALLKLTDAQKAAMETLINGGTIPDALAVGGMTKEELKKLYTAFSAKLKEARLEAMRRAKERMLVMPPVLFSSAIEIDELRMVGIVPWDELEGRKAPITPEQVKIKPKKPKKTAAEPVTFTPEQQAAIDDAFERFKAADPASWTAWWQETAKTLTPMIGQTSFEQFRERVMQPWRDRWQTEMQAITDPAGRITFDEWVAKPANTGKARPGKVLFPQPINETTGTLDFNDRISVKNALKAIATGRSSTMDRVMEWWRAAILSGPQTAIVNTGSNLSFGAFNALPRRAVEAAVNSMLNLVGQGSNESAGFGEFVAMAKHFRGAAKLAGQKMLQSWREESANFKSYALGMESQLNFGGKDAEHFMPALPGKIGDFMRSISFRHMMAADEFMKFFFGHIEVAAQAHRIAKAEGLTGTNYEARLADLIDNKGSVAWQRTFEKMQINTFQEDMKMLAGNTSAIRALDTLALKAKSLRAVPYIGRPITFFLPFINTPTNIAKQAIEITPLGGVLALIDGGRALKRRLSAGSLNSDGMRISKQEAKMAADELYNKARFVKDLTNQVIAWGLYFAISEMVEAGDDDELPLITGTMSFKSTKRGERDVANRVMPPQSIRLPGTNTFISYSRLDPFATAVAVLVDLTRDMNREGGFNAAVAGRLYTHVINAMNEKTFMQGFSNLYQAAQDPERFADRLAASTITGFVPNLIRQPIREIDPMKRDANPDADDSFAMSVAKRVGYSLAPMTAPPKMTVWGEELPANLGEPIGGHPVTNAIWRTLDPLNLTVGQKVDPLDLYIFTWNNQAADDEKIGIQPIDDYVWATIDGKRVKLPLTKEEHFQANRNAGREAKAMLEAQDLDPRNTTVEGAKIIMDTVRAFQTIERENIRNAKLASLPETE